eukprot:5816476-Prymnesium_polylepis.1
MAEVIIMIVDLLSGKAGEDVEGYGGSSWQVRFNNILLAVGKFVDLATDLILVVQIHAGAFGARPILVGSAVDKRSSSTPSLCSTASSPTER